MPEHNLPRVVEMLYHPIAIHQVETAGFKGMGKYILMPEVSLDPQGLEEVAGRAKTAVRIINSGHLGLENLGNPGQHFSGGKADLQDPHARVDPFS